MISTAERNLAPTAASIANVARSDDQNRPDSGSVTSLDLLVLRCSDIDATRAFYELIGITLDREQHDAGPEHYAAKLDEFTIELYPASPARPPEAGLRIGLRVNDVDRVGATLRAAGHQERDAPGSRSFLDPDRRIAVITGGPSTDG